MGSDGVVLTRRIVLTSLLVLVGLYAKIDCGDVNVVALRGPSGQWDESASGCGSVREQQGRGILTALPAQPARYRARGDLELPELLLTSPPPTYKNPDEESRDQQEDDASEDRPDNDTLAMRIFGTVWIIVADEDVVENIRMVRCRSRDINP